MSSQDTTNTAYTQRIQGETLVRFQDNNPTTPLAGPNGNTPSSTYTAMLKGKGLYISQGTGVRNIRPCCDGINVLDIVNSTEPDTIIKEGFYVTGSFEGGSLTFYNVNDTPGLTLQSNTSLSTFIAKYSSEGIIQWATRLGGGLGYSSFNNPAAVKVDNSGNLYIVGNYVLGASNTGLNIYNQGASNITDTPAFNISIDTYNAVFIVKYNTSGIALWVTKIQPDGDGCDATGLVIDPSGDYIYICGHSDFDNFINFYNAPGNTFTIPTIYTIDEDRDAFIVKYSSSGMALWATRIESADANGSLNSRGISIDANSNIYFVGSFTRTIKFYDAPGSILNTTFNFGVADFIFLCKYNSAGNLLWATRITSPSLSLKQVNIHTDSLGNSYLVGWYQNNMTFYDQPGTTFTITLPGVGSPRVFLVKYNSLGVAQWATRIQGSFVRSFSIVLNSASDIFICAIYNGTITLYNSDGLSSGISMISSTSPIWDFVVAKYNSNGFAQWAARIENTTSNEDRWITADLVGNIYVTGSYTNTVSFYNTGSAIPLFSLSAPATQNTFIVKYNTNGFIQLVRNIGSNNISNGISITAL